MRHNPRTTRHAAAAAAELAEDARSRGQELIDDVRERGREYFDEARARGRRAISRAEGAVRGYPGTAVAAAFIAGAALYAYLSSGRGERD